MSEDLQQRIDRFLDRKTEDIPGQPTGTHSYTLEEARTLLTALINEKAVLKTRHDAAVRRAEEAERQVIEMKNTFARVRRELGKALEG